MPFSWKGCSVTQLPAVPSQSASVEHRLLAFVVLVLLQTPNDASTWQMPAMQSASRWQVAPAFVLPELHLKSGRESAQLPHVLLGQSESYWQLPPWFGPPLHEPVWLQAPPGHSESCWQLAPAFPPPVHDPSRLQSVHATLFHVGDRRMSFSQSTMSCTPPCVSVYTRSVPHIVCREPGPM